MVTSPFPLLFKNKFIKTIQGYKKWKTRVVNEYCFREITRADTYFIKKNIQSIIIRQKMFRITLSLNFFVISSIALHIIYSLDNVLSIF